jgi:hypothetical protein
MNEPPAHTHTVCETASEWLRGPWRKAKQADAEAAGAEVGPGRAVAVHHRASNSVTPVVAERIGVSLGPCPMIATR